MRFLLSLCSACAFALPASAGEFTVGFGEADVTPETGKDKKPVFLAGFGMNRKATKVHDPIMARAVVLANGDEKIALVTVDVVGLFLPVVENVRAKLPGFKYVLVSATHNHEGPDTLGLWGASPVQSGIDPAYMKLLEAGCVDAVKAADNAPSPNRRRNRFGIWNATTNADLTTPVPKATAMSCSRSRPATRLIPVMAPTSAAARSTRGV